MNWYFKTRHILVLILFNPLLISCIEEEKGENKITSEDYIDGVFFVEHLDDVFQINIETSEPAKIFSEFGRPNH